MIQDLLLVAASYLLGSVSSAIIVCRLRGLPDPRTQGSNNPGATNVLRIGGKKAAAITLIGDSLKGLIPMLAGHLLSAGPTVLAATGLDVLTEPDLLKAIRDEFDKQKAGTEYKSLCDSKTNPQGNLSDPDIKHYECCIHAAEEHYGIKGLLS